MGILLCCCFLFILAIVHIFLIVRDLFLLFVVRAGTSIPPIFLRTCLLILLFSLTWVEGRINICYTFEFFCLLIVWQFYFFSLEGSGDIVMVWMVVSLGSEVNLAWCISFCLLFCLLFWANFILFTVACWQEIVVVVDFSRLPTIYFLWWCYFDYIVNWFSCIRIRSIY